jgi:chitin synthase
MANQKCLEITVKMLKVVAYLFTFVIVLGSGVIAKGTTLFMTSQLRKDRIIPFCNRDIGKCKKELRVWARFLVDLITSYLHDLTLSLVT